MCENTGELPFDGATQLSATVQYFRRARRRKRARLSSISWVCQEVCQVMTLPNNRCSRFSLGWTFAILGMWSVSFELHASEPAIADVVLAMQDLEKAITRLSVTAAIDLTQTDVNHPDAMAHVSRTEQYLFELDGRARCTIKGQGFRVDKKGTVSLRPLVAAGSFDGNECRFVRGRNGRIGLITVNRSDLPWTTDPRNLVTRYYGTPISQIIKDNGGQVVGSVRHGGRKLLVVETRAVKKDDNWMYRFWIDPARSFAVVKRSQLIQFPPHQNWLEFTRITWHEMEEVETGIWLPIRAVYESYNPTEKHADGSVEMPLAWRFAFAFTDWIVNPEVSDTAFAFEFPPGANVEDKINGRTYIVAGVNDSMLDEQAKTAREWEHTAARGWITVANLFVIGVLAAWVIWRRIHV